MGLSGAGCAKDKADPKGDNRLDPAQKHAPDQFEQSAADPPLTADTRFAAGQLAESQGNVELAVQQYRAALKLDPDHKQTLFRLGALYTEAKRYSEAVAVWQHYVKVTKQSADAYNDLALCYEQAGKLGEAEQTFKTALGRSPDNATCHVNYGLMLARAGRVDDATKQFQTVLMPAEVQYNLGAVFEQQGKLDEAKARYRRALELDPNLVDARSRLAVLK